MSSAGVTIRIGYTHLIQDMHALHLTIPRTAHRYKLSTVGKLITVYRLSDTNRELVHDTKAELIGQSKSTGKDC